MKNNSFHSTLTKIETTLEEYLVNKAPALPTNIKDILVVITPWFELIKVILVIPLVLALLGISTLAMPVIGMGNYGGNVLYVLLAVAEAVLTAMALRGLFNRQRMGWLYLFYAGLVSVVMAVVTLSVGSIVGLLISFYLLFQIRSYYK